MGFSERIRDVGAAYGDAVTRWDPDLLAGCFTKDAVWEAPGVRAEGRDSIVETIAAIRAGFDRILHLVHSVSVISEFNYDAAEADVRTYATELTSRRGKPGLLVNVYHDRCVLEGGRWLFAQRRLAVLYQGPPDLTGTFS